ncbi:MAG: hypothetical protein RSB36_05260 [Hydrogenoanaerobacterium sp.]
MKKFLAIVLAAVLALSMSTVAFASKVTDLGALGGDLFLFNEKNDAMEKLSVGGNPVPSGSVLYIPLVTRKETDNGIRTVCTYNVSDLSNYQIKTTVNEGKGIIGGVRFGVKKNSDGDAAAQIVVNVNQNTTKLPVEVLFTIKVTPDDGATLEQIDGSTEYDFNFFVAPQTKASAAAVPPAAGTTAPANTTTAPAKDDGAIYVFGGPVKETVAPVKDDGAIYVFGEPAKETVAPAKDDGAIYVFGEPPKENNKLVTSQTAPASSVKPLVNPGTGAGF